MVICLTILRFALFGPLDPPTNSLITNVLWVLLHLWGPISALRSGERRSPLIAIVNFFPNVLYFYLFFPNFFHVLLHSWGSNSLTSSMWGGALSLTSHRIIFLKCIFSKIVSMQKLYFQFLPIYSTPFSCKLKWEGKHNKKFVLQRM